MHSHQQWENFCKKQKEIRERDKINHFHKWINTNNNKKKLFILLDQINIAFKDSEYEFKNKKEFKDELATFIYKLSHNA